MLQNRIRIPTALIRNQIPALFNTANALLIATAILGFFVFEIESANLRMQQIAEG